jgi:cytochrome c
MKLLVAIAALNALAACSTAEDDNHTAQLQRGQSIAEANCSSCHAVGANGDSEAPEAPAFRTLSRNYRVDTLEEALAEGISVGHPAMPQFEFAPEDVDALVAYLQSIQEEPGPG